MNPFTIKHSGHLKSAESGQVKRPSRATEAAKLIAQGSLGLGGGMAAGYLVPKGLDLALRALRPGSAGIPPSVATNWIAPIATGGAGLAAALLYAQQQRAMNEIIEGKERSDR